MNEKYCGKNVLGERTQLRYCGKNIVKKHIVKRPPRLSLGRLTIIWKKNIVVKMRIGLSYF